MTNLLVAVYAKNRRHLTAFDMADDLVPLMMNHVTWIPELERETVPLLRVFLAEKWLVTRLHYGHVDPREAGVGNIVNCGAAMYMAPVGIANAGDPVGAYAEAVELGGSPPVQLRAGGGRRVRGGGRRGDGPGRDGGRRSSRRRPVSRGTARGRRSRRASARSTPGTDWREAIPLLRDAVTPYDSVGEVYRRARTGLAAAEPAAVHRGAAGGPRLPQGHRGRRPRARSSARRTTGATPTPSRRWAAPSPAPSAARPRSPRTGPRRSARRRASTCAPAAGPWPRSPRRSSPPTRTPGSSDMSAVGRLLEDRSGA